MEERAAGVEENERVGALMGVAERAVQLAGRGRRRCDAPVAAGRERPSRRAEDMAAARVVEPWVIGVMDRPLK